MLLLSVMPASYFQMQVRYALSDISDIKYELNCSVFCVSAYGRLYFPRTVFLRKRARLYSLVFSDHCMQIVAHHCMKAQKETSACDLKRLVILKFDGMSNSFKYTKSSWRRRKIELSWIFTMNYTEFLLIFHHKKNESSSLHLLMFLH